MNVLAWNCRSIHSDTRVFALQRLIQKHKPSMIFLSETMVRDWNFMNLLRHRLGFLNCEMVWSEGVSGLSGGLALLWKDGLKVDFLDKGKHFIDVIVHQEEQSGQPWRLTGFYGHPTTSQRHLSFQILKDRCDVLRLPWVVIGDFNELLNANEKRGGRVRSENQMQLFRNALSYCGLKDLGHEGEDAMTFWSPEQEERLDRAVANPDWVNLFPRSKLQHLPRHGGDHAPLLLSVLEALPKVRKKAKRFRFESFWADYEECGEVINNSWNYSGDGYPMYTTVQKIRSTRIALGAWQKVFFGQRGREIESTQNQLQALHALPFNDESLGERRRLTLQLDRLLNDEANYWKQRAKVKWLADGDCNSKYFFAKASGHRAKNFIRGLYDDNNQLQETQGGMSKVVLNYFKNIFKAGEYNLENMSRVVNLVQPKVTVSMNSHLCAPYSEEEIKSALFEMFPTKSPGPDGMPPLYYQKYWETTGVDVVAAQDYLHSGELLSEANYTHVCLIPKVPRPNKVTDLRPIALCNVIYKICAKALANRLKKILPGIISGCQSAFVPGRAITDNTLIANEVCHFIHTKSSGRGYMALKLDMSKAYDRMEWNYLEAILQRLGFDAHWVKVVMQSVKTVSYSFLVNGDVCGKMAPSRGLRQGDPLSPYLFLLCAEGLSALLEHKVNTGELQGIRICKNAPKVNHLLFADDSLLFGRATEDECKALNEVLRDYEAVSCQKINLAKSNVTFSKSVGEAMQSHLASLLGMNIVDKHDKYLGLPTYIGRKKTETFAYLKERLNNKLLGWQGKLLSSAGKELLIRVVAQSLPSYAMSLFMLPKGFCEDLEQSMAKFWWGSTEDNPRRHWQTWVRMCVPKEEGGLGFRDLHMHNIALLGKQVWRLCKEPDSLAYRLLREKYFPHGSILESELSHSPSDVWRGLHASLDYVKKGTRWCIGNGFKTRIWLDKWIPSLPSFTPELNPNFCGVPPTMVCDLISNNRWNEQVLDELFDVGSAHAIREIPISSRGKPDRVIWYMEGNGQYTVKSCYKLVYECCREIVVPYNETLIGLRKKIWFSSVPGKVKIHWWKILNRILPTVTELQRRGSTISGGCSFCLDPIESIEHVVGGCTYVRQVLDSSVVLDNRIPSIGNLDVVTWMGLMAYTLTRTQFQMFLILGWAIWRERNQRVWSAKFSSAREVEFQSKLFLDAFVAARLGKHRATVPRSNAMVTWSKPPIGWFKINCDGAFKTPLRNGAWAFVVRDEEGKIVGGGGGFLNYARTAMDTEARAVFEACKYLLDHQLSPAIIETDCRRLLEDLEVDESTGDILLEDMNDILRCCPNSNLSHIPRTANQAAHALVQTIYALQTSCIWIGDVPDELNISLPP